MGKNKLEADHIFSMYVQLSRMILKESVKDALLFLLILVKHLMEFQSAFMV